MGHPSCSKDHTICLRKDLLCTSLITLCKKGWTYDMRTNLWQATLNDYVLALRNSHISGSWEEPYKGLCHEHQAQFGTVFNLQLLLKRWNLLCAIIKSWPSHYFWLHNLLAVTLLSLNYILQEKVTSFPLLEDTIVCRCFPQWSLHLQPDQAPTDVRVFTNFTGC